MRERPIIFTTEMVQAILDGRKTQTRRVIKPYPEIVTGDMLSQYRWYAANHGDFCGDVERELKPPYGYPGCLLYVRETWARGCKEADPYCHCDTDELQKENHYYVYKADTPDAKYPLDWDDALAEDWVKDADFVPRWKPSIHMPKSASRIWLRVKDVRVERVQDITESDAKNEGVRVDKLSPPQIIFNTTHAKFRYRYAFQDLWDSINKKRGFGWESNPWVWVVSFEVISKTGRPGK